MCVWGHSVHTYAVCHSLSLCVDGVKSLVGKNCADKWVINRFGSDVFWMVDVSGSFVTFTRTRSPLAMTPPPRREAHNFRFPPPFHRFFSLTVFVSHFCWLIPPSVAGVDGNEWEKREIWNIHRTRYSFFFFLFVCPPPPSSSSCGLWEPRQL